MDPYKYGLHSHMSILTNKEEILVSYVHVTTRIFFLEVGVNSILDFINL